MKNILYAYTDGGSRGNPGNAAIGVLILGRDEKILKKHKEFIGHATNNQAEYRALIKALEFVSKLTNQEVVCTSDSEVMVRQLNGEYRVKDKKLMDLFAMVKKSEAKFEKVFYRHVTRDNNFIQIVDGMVNEELDGD